MCRGSTLRRLLVLALLTAAVVAVIGAGSAGAAPPQALVNGDTVSGGIGSMEAQEAIAAGFNVTVVSGATWDSMSQADFAGYQLLVIGDPTCSSLAASATSNYTTWAPVVMGTAGGNTKAGNRILIGTDPVFHTNFTKPQARHIIHDGIRFAGAIPGRTGLYFDDSCGDFTGENVLSALASLSTGSGTWTENHGPPCGASASLIDDECGPAGLVLLGPRVVPDVCQRLEPARRCDGHTDASDVRKRHRHGPAGMR
jgi:hypothetical protein